MNPNKIKATYAFFDIMDSSVYSKEEQKERIRALSVETVHALSQHFNDTHWGYLKRETVPQLDPLKMTKTHKAILELITLDEISELPH